MPAAFPRFALRTEHPRFHSAWTLLAFLLAALLPASDALAQEHAIRSETIFVPRKTDAQVDGLDQAQHATAVQYADRLKRGVQSVSVGIGPNGEDIVSFTTFDELGRVTMTHEPFALAPDATRQAGEFVSDAEGAQKAFYNPTGDNGDPNYTPQGIRRNTKPNARVRLERSPMARVEEAEAGSGQGWRFETERTVTTTRRFNTAGDEIKRVIHRDDGTFEWEFVPENTLTVVTVRNEDGVETQTFTDRSGNTVATRVLGREGTDEEPLTTLFTYDEYGQLRHKVAPGAWEYLKPYGSAQPVGFERLAIETDDNCDRGPDCEDEPDSTPRVDIVVSLSGSTAKIYYFDLNGTATDVAIDYFLKIPGERSWRKRTVTVARSKGIAGATAGNGGTDSDEVTISLEEEGAECIEVELDRSDDVIEPSTYEGNNGPVCVDSFEIRGISAEVVDLYITSYTYDGYGRLVEERRPIGYSPDRKAGIGPGIGSIGNPPIASLRGATEGGDRRELLEYVYDRLGRKVLWRDAVMRDDGVWLFQKFDREGRVILNGIYAPDQVDQGGGPGQEYAEWTRVQWQEHFLAVTDLDDMYEVRVDYDRTAGHGYTMRTLPTTNNCDVWTATYFDDYGVLDELGVIGIDAASFAFEAGVFPAQGGDEGDLYLEGFQRSDRTRGMATVTKEQVFDDTGSYLWGVTYYDRKGRAIQTQSLNQFNRVDVTSMQYDFAGKVIRTQTKHGGPDGTVYMTGRTQYDHAQRPLRSFVGLGTNPSEDDEITVAKNVYDVLGRVSETYRHHRNSGGEREVESFATKTVNRYNERGWLLYSSTKEVDASFPLYEYYLTYNWVDPGRPAELEAAPRYDGGVKTMMWRTAEGGSVGPWQTYAYHYDHVGRLTQAQYGRTSGGQPWEVLSDFSVPLLTYDANSNLRRVQRHGADGQLIDDLTYTYHGNRLLNITEAATETEGHDFRSYTPGPVVLDAGTARLQIVEVDVRAAANGETDRVNRNGGEYIILQNVSDQFVDLDGWVLRDPADAGQQFGFSDFRRCRGPAGSTGLCLIAPGAQVTVANDNDGAYTTRHGKAPDYAFYPAFTHSQPRALLLNDGDRGGQRPDDDDVLELVAPDGTVVDLVSWSGTQAAGQTWHLTDGGATRVLRRTTVDATRAPEPGDWAVASLGGALTGGPRYEYNANGELVWDPHKRMRIERGYLHIPRAIRFEGNRRIEWIRTATGRVLRQEVWDGLTRAEQTNYSGAFVYRWEAGGSSGAGPTLDFVKTGGGRAKRTGPGLGDGEYEWEYFLADHLGNTRVSFGVAPSGGTETLAVRQVADYYPYGLRFAAGGTGVGDEGENRYLYNGKEVTEAFGLGWYDYGARFYDPAVARWWAVDPLDELASHYSYVGGDPVNFTDPDGMQMGATENRPSEENWQHPNPLMDLRPNRPTDVGGTLGGQVEGNFWILSLQAGLSVSWEPWTGEVSVDGSFAVGLGYADDAPDDVTRAMRQRMPRELRGADIGGQVALSGSVAFDAVDNTPVGTVTEGYTGSFYIAGRGPISVGGDVTVPVENVHNAPNYMLHEHVDAASGSVTFGAGVGGGANVMRNWTRRLLKFRVPALPQADDGDTIFAPNGYQPEL